MNIVLFILASLVVGFVSGVLYEKRKKSYSDEEARTLSDQRWRNQNSDLIGYLLCLGYEVKVEGGVLEAYAPGNVVILSLHFRQYAPKALHERLANLPPASEWENFRESVGDEEDEGDEGDEGEDEEYEEDEEDDGDEEDVSSDPAPSAPSP